MSEQFPYPGPEERSGSKPAERKHWLVRPETIVKLWWAFWIVLGAVVAVQYWIPVHDYFVVDGWFGFHAVYGFLSCVAMVAFAKLLGYLLKRPFEYYFDDDA